MKKQRKNIFRHHVFLLFIAACFCLSVAAGFIGGLYFSQTRPESARQATETAIGAAASIAQRLDPRGYPGLQTRTAGLDTGAIQVFFVPNRHEDVLSPDEALLRLIAGAREHIFCAFYDLELESVALALIERHRAGVRVAIVSDSDYAHKAGVGLCLEAGIPVVFDGRTALMHNKFCVVDGRLVWTGSTNITHNCMFRNNNNAVLIESRELAVNFTNEFEEMFLLRQFGAGSPQNTAFPTLTVMGIGLECYFAPEDGVEQAVIARLARSTEQIDFMAFVFTSVPIAEAMAARLAAGAHVRGVLERRSAGSRHSRHEYLRSHGAEIHVDTNPHTMHHKVIVVDARLVMTGSYNFSANADKRNDENLLVIHNEGIARRFIEELEFIIE